MAKPGPKPGSKFKKTIEREMQTRRMLEKATAEGKLQPLEVLLHLMHDAWRDYDAGGRVDKDARKQLSSLASEAAPYVHARLATVDTTIRADNIVRYISDKPMDAADWEAEAQKPGGFGSAVH